MKSVCMRRPAEFFRELQHPGERYPLARRNLGKDRRLLGRLEVLQDGDGVVGIEIADALGDVARRQVLEDLHADRLVELGERGEVEVVAEKADQPGTLVGVERLDQVGDIGLVERAGEFARGRRVIGSDRAARPRRRNRRQDRRARRARQPGRRSRGYRSDRSPRLSSVGDIAAIGTARGVDRPPSPHKGIRCRPAEIRSAAKAADQEGQTGAVEKTRTSTGCPTATSTLRVYQFRHDRMKSGFM